MLFEPYSNSDIKYIIDDITGLLEGREIPTLIIFTDNLLKCLRTESETCFMGC